MEQMLVAQMETPTPDTDQSKTLSYDEVGSEGDIQQWKDILNQFTVKKSVLRNAILSGVPKSMRGDIWQYLAENYSQRSIVFQTPYQELLQGLTPSQHSILIDLGRTFPNHPYFSSPLGAGQLSLFNLLKAYSLLDPEIGYCQGLSFVAGLLILHMPEAKAFNMLKHLLQELDLRQQYSTNMKHFQVQMYQLDGLLRERCPTIYSHLTSLQINPGLYGSSWFLTMYAAEFPLWFSSRIMDFIFYEGSDVLFKVALLLLVHHEEDILSLDCFELVVNFLKKSVTTSAHLSDVLEEVLNINISSSLRVLEKECLENLAIFE